MNCYSWLTIPPVQDPIEETLLTLEDKVRRFQILCKQVNTSKKKEKLLLELDETAEEIEHLSDALHDSLEKASNSAHKN